VSICMQSVLGMVMSHKGATEFKIDVLTVISLSIHMLMKAAIPSEHLITVIISNH
jgi:hypothetical protein